MQTNKPRNVLSGEQQRTVGSALAKNDGELPLEFVAALLAMPQPEVETALRFSGFLVNENIVT